MRFREFESIVKDFPLFKLNDIRKFAPDFHRRQLTTWTRKGFLKSIAAGYYVFAETNVDESFLFMAANLIYEPSYISLESALAYYQVIPETVLGVTSISSRKTYEFLNEWGIFRYRSIKRNLMFGYEVVEKNHHKKYKMAKLEKAILDYLYLNTGVSHVDDFEELRWNRERLVSQVDQEIFNTYMEIFNISALAKRVAILKEYLHA